MSFSEQYKSIIEPVSADFVMLDEKVSDYFSKKEGENNQILPIIKEFVSNSGKRLRPALIFLWVHALNKEVDSFCIKNAMACEFIHNATLIHDDIIDCSLIRRGKKTLNFDYDSKLAVLAGDYLLSEVLKMLSSVDNEKIRTVYSKAVSKMVQGELHQYFNRFKLLSIEKYIEKSRDKTARLFEAGLMSAYLFENDNPVNLDCVKSFGKNFGIAFQILNDLENLNSPEKINEDVQNGDYSAPLIYFAKEKYGDEVDTLNSPSIALKQLKNSDAVQKTMALAKYYLNSAIENTAFLEDNLYKRAIIDLCNLYASK